MDRYAHTVVEELSEALDRLPELGGDRPSRERQAATGTDGNFLPSFLPKSLPRPAASADRRIASDRTEALNRSIAGAPANPSEQGLACTHSHSIASTGVDGNRTHQALRQQRLNGFEDRGTHQASGHSLRTLGNVSFKRRAASRLAQASAPAMGASIGAMRIDLFIGQWRAAHSPRDQPSKRRDAGEFAANDELMDRLRALVGNHAFQVKHVANSTVIYCNATRAQDFAGHSCRL